MTQMTMSDDARIITETEKTAYLIISENKRTKMNDLAAKLKLSTRETRKVVEMLRTKGIRIGADEKGYFLCKDDKEFRAFMMHYIAPALRRFNIADKMQRNNNGQEVICQDSHL